LGKFATKEENIKEYYMKISLSTPLPAIDTAWQEKAVLRQNSLTKPQGSLGRLEEIAHFLCGWQQTLTPQAGRAYTLIFAGNHGVTAQGVSAFPTEVTAQMVANFKNGGAAINQLCAEIPSDLRIIPLSLETPTQDFTTAPAMSLAECEAAFQIGAENVPQDADILIIGEMGIGNTTIAAALGYALMGGKIADFVGAGTGVDAVGKQRKTYVIEQAVALHSANLQQTIPLLQHIGGREQAAMAGAIWQARLLRIPVILDGFVATAAAATLYLTAKDALAHCLAGHLSVECGHKKLLDFLGLQPILDLNMRLGEGSGAQIALAIVRSAIATFNNMATFEEAAVAGKMQ
jgi:nicotinate-nucleotide--dimethylbenzimidazole phosphoribosyltransferase